MGDEKGEAEMTTLAIEKDTIEERKGINTKKKKNRNERKRNEMRICTWNIQTMLRPGKINEIGHELQKYRIDVAALQEIRWKEKGIIEKKDFSLYYSGAKKQGQHGVGFVLMRGVRDKVLEYKPINERLAYIRLQAKPVNVSILNVYAPTEIADKEDKDEVYEKIEEEVDKMPKEDAILLLGDFNAQIGKEDYIEQVAGKYTIHDKTNDNGKRLCNMATATNMIISSTKFQHPRHHKITWTTPDQKTGTQIDHILINRRRQSSVKDVRTYRGICTDTDHFMVMATVKQK